MERVWVARLRWRMRGAWLWPCFVVITLLEGVLLLALPPWEEGPSTVVSGMLLAGFANLLVVAVLARVIGARLRRRRSDMPRGVAENYAGTALLLVLAATWGVLGLAHRPAAAGARADVAAASASARDYVRSRGPAGYRERADRVDVLRLSNDSFRACVAGRDVTRSLCLFVDTSQQPPGITVDPDQTSNVELRTPGGFH